MAAASGRAREFTAFGGRKQMVGVWSLSGKAEELSPRYQSGVLASRFLLALARPQHTNHTVIGPMYRKALALLVLLLSAGSGSLSPVQGGAVTNPVVEEPVPQPDSSRTGRSSTVGVGAVGVGLGDTERTTGLRLNWRNGQFQRANGVNLTLWTPYSVNLGDEDDLVDENGELGGDAFVGTTNGVALGLLHFPRRIRGIGIGGFGPVAGTLQGVAVSGIVVATVEDLNGIAVGAGGAAAAGDINGIAVGGLAAGADGPGAGEGTGPDAGGTVNGIVVGGLGAVGNDMRGAGVSAGMVRVREGGTLKGLAVSAYNDINGRQVGLSIGLYNHARVLDGVQIGLLNVARNNPEWARILPILNLNL